MKVNLYENSTCICLHLLQNHCYESDSARVLKSQVEYKG